MFYPSGYRCKAVRVAGGIMRCNEDAGPSGFCPEHEHEHEGAHELPPMPPLILIKLNVKEGSWVWKELLATGVKVVDRDPVCEAARNDKRAAEEVFRKGVAFQDRIQPMGQSRQAGTGVPVFGVGGHKGPFYISRLISELAEVGYSIVGYHILRDAHKSWLFRFVIALTFGGKPEEGCDWAKVGPIAECLHRGFSFGANVWVNPPPIDHPELGGSHALDFNFGKSDAPAKYVLRWDDGSWGLEPVSVPAPEASIDNSSSPSA